MYNLLHKGEGDYVSFFKNEPGVLAFDLYNVYHFIAIFVFITLAVMIIIFRKKLRVGKIDFRVRVIATVLVFGMEIIFQISNYVYDTDFILNFVPLHLCSLTFWLALVVNITKSRFLFNLLYFWGVGGIVTFVYPDIIGIGPDKMRYYQFFGDHAYIVLSVVYFIFVFGYRINFKSLVQAIAVLFPIAVLVRMIDSQFYDSIHANWMYLSAPPEFETILDMLPQGGWLYFFSVISVGLVAFILAYLPWGITNLLRKKTNQSETLYERRLE